MKLDKKAIDRILSLDDESLRAFLTSLAEKNGIDISSLPIDTRSIESIRSSLRNATEDDLKAATEELRRQSERRNHGRN